MPTYVIDESGVVQFVRPGQHRVSAKVSEKKRRKVERRVQAILNSRSLQRCPECHLPIEGKQLMAHLTGGHRYSEYDVVSALGGSGSVLAPASSSNAGVASHAGDHTALRSKAAPSGGIDGASGLAAFARERGRFGSFSKHDDYGEDSTAD